MRFGIREICDVTFKALTNMKVGTQNFVAGQPVFMIDTAQTSNFEQASTTTYAQGGRGYNRLIAWEGEKTMTFAVTDALMSPMGLAVLSGAGLIDAAADNVAHVHVTYDVATNAQGKGTISVAKLNEELGLAETKYYICDDVPQFGAVLGDSGAMEKYLGESDIVFNTVADSNGYIVVTNEETVTIASAPNSVVKLDFYVGLKSNVKTVSIEPNSFGGYFYVEADTLFRDEATGRDMAASIIFPKVKVQSAFTFTMAASGDPSTFDFTMDAMPAYTWFDRTKKVVCDIQILSRSDDAETTVEHKNVSGPAHTPTTAGA